MRASTRSVYDSRWKIYVNWCLARKRDPFSLPVTKVLDFLQEKADKLQWTSVQGYVTAISHRHSQVKFGSRSYRLSKLPSLQTWLKGLKEQKGVPRVLVPTWNLEIVLSALKRAPYHPVESIDLKHLTWKAAFLVAITSARRASEIHALRADSLQFGSSSVTASVDINFVPKVASAWHCNQLLELPAMHEDADPSLKALCVRRTLNAYVKATSKLRKARGGVNQLFLCYGIQKRGLPVSKTRISEWLKLVIADCYRKMQLDEPQGVKGHQVRKQATSWADMAGVDPQKICDAAIWKSKCMFARHYRLDLSHSVRSDFGRRILQASASSSTETLLQRHLDAAAPSSSSGLSLGFRIPKLPGQAVPDQ